jgi:SAM-dependent methyltransferase
LLRSIGVGLPMSEITHGLRAVLSYSKIYDLFQGIMGARKGRSIFSARYIRAQEGDRVLDIGCGTAETRDFLPAVEYYGFDPNPKYIRTAQKRLRDVPGCTFLCATVDEAVLGTLPKFDIVLALGVLHHLDDEAVVRLAKLAKGALKEKGRLILVDPCFVGYRDLMSTAFGVVQTEIRNDLIRFPYTHLIMECVAE